MLLPLRKKVTISFIVILCAFCAVTAYLMWTPSAEKEIVRASLDQASVNEYPLTVTDDYGRKVTIPEKPLKVISLAPSITEMLCSLGFQDRLKAVTEWCNRPADVTELPNVGRIDEPNIEVILEIHPDVIVGTELTPKGVYDKLTKLGFSCIALKHDGLKDVMKDSLTLSTVMGDHLKGVAFSNHIETELENTLQHLKSVKDQPKRRVAILFDINNLFSVGKNTWLSDLIEKSHAENIADTAPSSWPKLTMEALLESDPDVILVTDGTDASSREVLHARVASLKDDPAWKHMKAVKEGRVVILENHGEYMIPGPRMIDAFKGIAHAVYPECFADQ